MALEIDDEAFRLVIEARELASDYGLEGSTKAIQTALSIMSLEIKERSQIGLPGNPTSTRQDRATTVFALKFHSNKHYSAVERDS